MKNNQQFTVNKESQLLDFLLTCFSNKSRNHVKGILKRGQVTVDGKATTSHSKMLKPGQQVKIVPQTEISNAYKIKIPIIYEDDHIIVIDKPTGILSVSTSWRVRVKLFSCINLSLTRYISSHSER